MLSELLRMTAVGSALLIGAATIGADEPAAAPAVEPDGILAGPKVEETTGGPQSFGEDAMSPRRDEPQVPFRMWQRAVRELELTDEQLAALEPIIAELEAAGAEFEAKHGERARELRRQVREARQAGREPSIELQKERLELRRLGPDTEAFQRRILALLTAEQVTTLDERLAVMKQRLGREGAGNRGPDGERMDDASPAPAPRSDPMVTPPAQPSTPSPVPQLDEIGQRRVAFLRSRQAKSAASPTSPPTAR